MDHVAQGFEALGAAILVVGVIWSFILAVVAARRFGWSAKAYLVLRQAFGHGLQLCPPRPLRVGPAGPSAGNVLVMSGPRGRASLSTDRLAAFSDGVLAIAATLLVLEIAVHPPGTLLEQVLHAWPGYLAYAVSFLTIGATWLAHTALTDRLTRSDPIFLQLNLVLLLVVAFLPFPTRLVIDALHDVGDERVAVTMYGLTLLAIRLMAAAMDAYARREHLYSQQEDGEELQSAQRKLLPAIIGYVIVILIGLLVPRAAVTLYFFLAVYLIVPFGEMARLLFRRS